MLRASVRGVNPHISHRYIAPLWLPRKSNQYASACIGYILQSQESSTRTPSCKFLDFQQGASVSWMEIQTKIWSTHRKICWYLCFQKIQNLNRGWNSWFSAENRCIIKYICDKSKKLLHYVLCCTTLLVRANEIHTILSQRRGSMTSALSSRSDVRGYGDFVDACHVHMEYVCVIYTV